MNDFNKISYLIPSVGCFNILQLVRKKSGNLKPRLRASLASYASASTSPPPPPGSLLKQHFQTKFLILFDIRLVNIAKSVERWAQMVLFSKMAAVQDQKPNFKIIVIQVVASPQRQAFMTWRIHL